MTFKNAKTKTTLSLLMAALITISITQSSLALPVQSNKILDPTNSEDAKCLEQIRQDMHKKYALFDENKSLRTAVNYDKLQAEIVNKKHTTPVAFAGWDLDPIKCTATLTGSFVDYIINDVDGVDRHITVRIDPRSMVALDISKTEVGPRHSNVTATNWAGYQIKGSSSGTTSVYQSELTYKVPRPDQPTVPSGFTCGTSGSSRCQISVWSGLSTVSGGTSGLSQTGTDSYCKGTNCSSGRTYTSWLELYNGAGNSQNLQIDCTATFTPASGDSIYSAVRNNVLDGGSNSVYHLYLTDLTQNKACNRLNQSYNVGDPKYAEYIQERPEYSGVFGKLAKFDPIGMTGTINYGGLTRSIQVPYSNGASWYDEIEMANGSPQKLNIDMKGGISSAGKFTTYWVSSENTG